MKRSIFSRLLPIACLLVLALIYVRATQSPAKVEDYRYRYTFLCPLNWSNVASGLLQADRENHTNTKMMGVSQMDIAKQVKTLEQVILSRPDGIITAAPVDSEGFRAALKEAKKRQIPVILVDSDLPGTERDCYVGTDNLQNGTLAGEQMVKATGGKGKIACLVSSMDYPNQRERVDAFEKVIAAWPEMEVVDILECHSSRLEIMDLLPSFLLSHPEVDALYLTEAIGGSLVGEILTAQFSSRPLTIVSTDDMASIRAYLEKGIYCATIAQRPWEEGYQAGMALTAIREGKPVPKIIYTGSRVITRENLREQENTPIEEVVWDYY